MQRILRRFTRHACSIIHGSDLSPPQSFFPLRSTLTSPAHHPHHLHVLIIHGLNFPPPCIVCPQEYPYHRVVEYPAQPAAQAAAQRAPYQPPMLPGEDERRAQQYQQQQAMAANQPGAAGGGADGAIGEAGGGGGGAEPPRESVGLVEAFAEVAEQVQRHRQHQHQVRAWCVCVCVCVCVCAPLGKGSVRMGLSSK